MNKERLLPAQASNTRLLSCGIRFFLAAALTATRMRDGAAPFALGSVAAAGPGAEGICALLGSGVGCLLFLDFSAGLAHMAAGILIFTASRALQGLAAAKRPLFFPVLSAGMFFLIRLIYLLESSNPLAGVLSCLADTLLTGLSAWVYGRKNRDAAGQPDPRGLYFLAATLLAALEDVAPAGISLGRAASGTLVLAAGCQGGAAAGTAAGLCSGLLLDLCGGEGLFCTAAFALTGLAAGWREQRNRWTAALGFAAAAVVLALPAPASEGTAFLKEAAVGVGLFLLLPGRLFAGKRVRRRTETEDRAAAAGLKAGLSRCAAVFRDLYDSMGRPSGNGTEENPAILFDRAAERVCRDCALCTLCWRKDYNTTFNALNDATPYLLERGRVMAKDFPEHFSSRCIHLTEFIGAVNQELSAFLLRRRYRRELEETRSNARRQYAQLSDLLSATAAGLEERVPAAAVSGRSCTIGAALRPRKGQSVCGDSVCSFQTERGTWCLLLSDGMGTGEEARRESALTLRLMRQFLEAGVEAEAALKTLNSALALRGTESQSFSTIDLLTLRPESGEAALYKYGAAPTYLKRAGRVRRITGGALPAGIRPAGSPPDVTRFQMEPGTFAVMISDGVADALSDEWLQDLLAGWDGTDPQVLAGLILAEAARRTDAADDCGVQVLRLDEGTGAPPEKV